MSGSMTVLTTVLSGTFLVIIGQILQHYLFAPLQEQKQTIGDISFALLYIGNIGPCVNEKEYSIAESPIDATRRVRMLAARLTATLNTVPYYDWCARRGFVRPRKEIDEAIGQLIRWSNAIQSGQPGAARTAVAQSLHLNVQGAEPLPNPRIDEQQPPEKSIAPASEFKS